MAGRTGDTGKGVLDTVGRMGAGTGRLVQAVVVRPTLGTVVPPNKGPVTSSSIVRTPPTLREKRVGLVPQATPP